jgi:hypothetical protein
MKSRKLMCVAALTLFAAVPTAMASTTRYVNGVTGSDSNNCLSPTTACKTIGHAISLSSSGDSIMVAAATYTENLAVAFSLKIVGAGTATTIVDGGGGGTVVTIAKNTLVTLSKMTIRNGAAEVGGGINNSGTLTISNSIVSDNKTVNRDVFGAGGGINNSGTLTISNSTLSGNSAFGSGAFGGGIYNVGTLTINNSTLSHNNAFGSKAAFGGGIFSARATGVTLTISNSTISSNSASDQGGHGASSGGGIANESLILTISNSTLSQNSASGAGGGILNSSGSTAALQNSIVANNLSGENCSGTITSNGFNLSSDDTCNFNSPGDMNNINPNLGPLQNNGGPTQTMALLPGSPAIDTGNPSGCTDGQGHLLKTDQRGRPRPDKEDTGGCDRGAYERQTD